MGLVIDASAVGFRCEARSEMVEALGMTDEQGSLFREMIRESTEKIVASFGIEIDGDVSAEDDVKVGESVEWLHEIARFESNDRADFVLDFPTRRMPIEERVSLLRRDSSLHLKIAVGAGAGLRDGGIANVGGVNRDVPIEEVRE